MTQPSLFCLVCATLRTWSAAARSRRVWIHHAWRLWLSLFARGLRQRLAVGSSFGGQLGDAARDFVHCSPIPTLNCGGACGVQFGSTVLRVGQVFQQVLSHLLFEGADFCVGHNDKHDNHIALSCQVGQFWPKTGPFWGVL